MTILRALPSTEYSFASSALKGIQQRADRKQFSAGNEIGIRFKVGELALRTIGDIMVHLTTAVVKTARVVIELPLYVIGIKDSPRVTLLEAGSHVSRSMRSTLALFATGFALLKPTTAQRAYNYLGIGIPDKDYLARICYIAKKAWTSPYRNRALLAGATLAGAAFGYRYTWSGASVTPPIATPTHSTNTATDSTVKAELSTSPFAWLSGACFPAGVGLAFFSALMCLDRVCNKETQSSEPPAQPAADSLETENAHQWWYSPLSYTAFAIQNSERPKPAADSPGNEPTEPRTVRWHEVPKPKTRTVRRIKPIQIA